MDHFKNEDYIKNENNLKNESDLTNEDDYKTEDGHKMKMASVLYKQQLLRQTWGYIWTITITPRYLQSNNTSQYIWRFISFQ